MFSGGESAFENVETLLCPHTPSLCCAFPQMTDLNFEPCSGSAPRGNLVSHRAVNFWSLPDQRLTGKTIGKNDLPVKFGKM